MFRKHPKSLKEIIEKLLSIPNAEKKLLSTLNEITEQFVNEKLSKCDIDEFLEELPKTLMTFNMYMKTHKEDKEFPEEVSKLVKSIVDYSFENLYVLDDKNLQSNLDAKLHLRNNLDAKLHLRSNLVSLSAAIKQYPGGEEAFWDKFVTQTKDVNTYEIIGENAPILSVFDLTLSTIRNEKQTEASLVFLGLTERMTEYSTDKFTGEYGRLLNEGVGNSTEINSEILNRSGKDILLFLADIIFKKNAFMVKKAEKDIDKIIKKKQQQEQNQQQNFIDWIKNDKNIEIFYKKNNAEDYGQIIESENLSIPVTLTRNDMNDILSLVPVEERTKARKNIMEIININNMRKFGTTIDENSNFSKQQTNNPLDNLGGALDAISNMLPQQEEPEQNHQNDNNNSNDYDDAVDDFENANKKISLAEIMAETGKNQDIKNLKDEIVNFISYEKNGQDQKEFIKNHKNIDMSNVSKEEANKFVNDNIAQARQVTALFNLNQLLELGKKPELRI